MVFASATIWPISSFATPRSPGREMARALALASLITEIGPCSPAMKTAAVTRSGASVNACHSSSVKTDLSLIRRSSCVHGLEDVVGDVEVGVDVLHVVVLLERVDDA